MYYNNLVGMNFICIFPKFSKVCRYQNDNSKVNTILRLMKQRNFPIYQNENLFFKDGELIGEYWYSVKAEFKCNRHPYYKLLENPILKKDYENYCNKYCIVTSKINQLKETMNYRKDPIMRESRLSFLDGTKMGEFWYLCKKYSLCDALPYLLLLENHILKKDYKDFIKYTKNPINTKKANNMFNDKILFENNNHINKEKSDYRTKKN